MPSLLRPAKQAAKLALDKLGLWRAVESAQARGPLVVIYHGVEEVITDPAMQSLHIPLARFAMEMDHFRREYRVVSLDELSREVKSPRPDRRAVAITFDDAFVNVHRLAGPLLASQGLPFAVFANPAYLDQGGFLPSHHVRTLVWRSGLKRLTLDSLGQTIPMADDGQRRQAQALLGRAVQTKPWPQAKALVEELQAAWPAERREKVNQGLGSERIMTWAQARELAAMGATIASHGHEHMTLAAHQSDEDLLGQLTLSRQALAREMGECRYLAYPRGKPVDICRRAVAMARAAGYEMAFTAFPGEIGAGLDPLLLPRVFTPGAPDLTPGPLKAMLARRRRLRAEYERLLAQVA